LFLAIAIADWQSQCIDTDGVGFIPNGILANKLTSGGVIKYHCP